MTDQELSPHVVNRTMNELIVEFEKLGVDITTEQGRREFREDMKWARDNRRRCEKSVGALIVILLGGISSVLGVMLVDGAKRYFGGGQ